MPVFSLSAVLHRLGFAVTAGSTAGDPDKRQSELHQDCPVLESPKMLFAFPVPSVRYKVPVRKSYPHNGDDMGRFYLTIGILNYTALVKIG